MKGCSDMLHFVTQIIAKGVDPDMQGSDGLDALAYLQAAATEGESWATPALERIVRYGVGETRERVEKRKRGQDDDDVLEDVSGCQAWCLWMVLSTGV
jgi:hypothetical protein